MFEREVLCKLLSLSSWPFRGYPEAATLGESPATGRGRSWASNQQSSPTSGSESAQPSNTGVKKLPGDSNTQLSSHSPPPPTTHTDFRSFQSRHQQLCTARPPLRPVQVLWALTRRICEHNPTAVLRHYILGWFVTKRE